MKESYTPQNNNSMDVIITAPSLDTRLNVSGVSSVVSFIIDNNPKYRYVHFQLGKTDKQKGGIIRIKATLKALKHWHDILKQNQHAIIHYSFPLSKPSLLRDPLFMWLAKKHKRKMVIHIHGGLFLTKKKISFLWMKILKWVFSWNVPFIVLSENEAKTLRTRFGAKQVKVLPNCVDLKEAKAFHRFDNCDSKESIIRIGYLGRIEQNKGITELLEACVKLKEEGIPFELEIAGKEAKENEYLPLFSKKLGNNFHYVGVIYGETKVSFLKRLEVFVLPSYFEGLPVSLLECMSYGCVPVVTPVGSIPEIVTDGENGMLIKAHDINSIVDKVTFLYKHRDIMKRIGINARNTIFNQYNPQKYIEKLNTLYRTL